MIQFENVSLSYGGAAAVRDLSFTVGRGEFVALVGANGAGKTTVSKLMNGWTGTATRFRRAAASGSASRSRR